MWKKILLTLKWAFGYRAVFMREPSTSAMMVYVHMKRMVAKKTCPVCHCKYWVIGNPKIKGHFSPVCGKRKCYLTYYGDWNGKPVIKMTTPVKVEFKVKAGERVTFPTKGGKHGIKRHYSVAKEL